MRVVFDPGMIVRVVPSTSARSPGRVYVHVVDVKGEGQKIEFSVDGANYSEILQEVNGLRHIECDLTSYTYTPEGGAPRLQWKGSNVVIKPYKENGKG